jgi:hypothetical protein
MPEPTYRMAGQSKETAVERLSFEQRKNILKWYWKFENICELRREWRREFATETPTRLIIASIRDKLEGDVTVHKCTNKDLGGLAQQHVPSLLLWSWNSLHDQHESPQDNVNVRQELADQVYNAS